MCIEEIVVCPYLRNIELLALLKNKQTSKVRHVESGARVRVEYRLIEL